MPKESKPPSKPGVLPGTPNGEPRKGPGLVPGTPDDTRMPAGEAAARPPRS
jgi:hypothetical protein